MQIMRNAVLCLCRLYVAGISLYWPGISGKSFRMVLNHPLRASERRVAGVYGELRSGIYILTRRRDVLGVLRLKCFVFDPPVRVSVNSNPKAS